MQNFLVRSIRNKSKFFKIPTSGKRIVSYWNTEGRTGIKMLIARFPISLIDSKNTISLRHYKCFAHLQKTCEISGLPTDSVVDITLLSLRSTQLNTRSIGWHICSSFRKSRFQTSTLKLFIQYFTAVFSVKIS